MARHTYFFTGTFRAQSHDLDEVAECATRWLKRMRKRVTDRCKDRDDWDGTTFRYLLLPERHKSGAWHYHALVHHSGNVAHRDFRTWTDGFYNVRPIVGSGLREARYITKYCTKDLLEEDSKRPRIRASRNPTYGGPVVIRDLDLVQMIQLQRDTEGLNDTWTKNLKMLMKEMRKEKESQTRETVLAKLLDGMKVPEPKTS